VIDAMFRQVYSDETIPYSTHTIPGVVYATDFDMGVIGAAYYDNQAANYQVSTGDYTPWNNGWVYRNDGVDIEPCSDNVNTNGYSVGFLDTDEWMQYEVNVAESGVYEIHVRVASGGSGGRLYFAAEEAPLTSPYFAPPTGGWQSWETLVIPNVILDPSDKKLRLYVDAAGFNVNSFEFVETGVASTSIPAEFVAAVTLDEYSVQMNTNKFLDAPLPAVPGGFEILVDGTSIPITGMAIDADNPRIINFSVDYILKSTETIQISYTGSVVKAIDGTDLNNFILEDVENTLFYVHPVPGKIEAEAYFSQSGVELETTTDIGGGQNIGFLDPGDYLDYEINVETDGTYQVDYRTASLDATGAIELQLIDNDGNASLLHAPTFAPTGDWQTWTTTSENVQLTAGRYKMRIVITQSPFNMNWSQFTLLSTSTEETDLVERLKVFPNPNTGLFSLEGSLMERQNLEIQIHNLLGQSIWKESLRSITDLRKTIDLRSFPNGSYLLSIRTADGEVYTQRIVKTGL
jgi:endoglucanase